VCYVFFFGGLEVVKLVPCVGHSDICVADFRLVSCLVMSDNKRKVKLYPGRGGL
jgi:hypothetical protein